MFSLLFLIHSALLPLSPARAEPPMIEVLAPSTPPPGALELGELGARASTEAERTALVRQWLDQRKVKLPEADPALLARDLNFDLPRALSNLVVRAQQFIQDVNGQSDTHLSGDFRAQYTREIKGAIPGMAWVVIASRSSFETDYNEVVREGGGLGVQVPLLGSRTVQVKNHNAQLLLRLLPLAGNYEMTAYGDDPYNRTESPDTGIIVRPSAEVEATLREGTIVPGARFLFQPRLTEPGQYRMLAEVFVNFEIKSENRWFPKVSVVPRCLLDYSNQSKTIAAIDDPELRSLFSFGNRILTCGVNTEFTLGN